MQCKSPLRRAFTLVELLVVIGIVAVLIGILLPSLSAAREAARNVVCKANMRSATQAMLMYVSQSKGWLPGPHTSGRGWGVSPNMDGNNFGIDSIGLNESGGKQRPTQNFDWMSPTLGMTGLYPDNDLKRLQQIYSTALYCPSNEVNFTEFALDSDGVGSASEGAGALRATDFKFMSYSASITFHIWPSREGSVVPQIYQRTGSNNKVVYPTGYSPKITEVGDVSRKAFIIEGARYISGENLSFNLARYQIQGGNFMAVGPWTRYDNGPYNLPGTTVFLQNWTSKQISKENRRFAWRHRNDRMNIAFFDGHVESRLPGESIQTELYLPKGTRITNASLTYDPTDSNNQVVN